VSGHENRSSDDKEGSHLEAPIDAPASAGTERNIDDVNVWAVVKFAIGLLIIGIVSYVVLFALLKVFTHQEQSAERPAPPMQRTAEERLPPAPRLQMMPGSPSGAKSPDYEMRAMVEEEEKTLNGYGWVDKNAGVVRIPIDVAMKRLLEKGVSANPSPTPAGPSPTPASSSPAAASPSPIPSPAVQASPGTAAAGATRAER